MGVQLPPGLNEVAALIADGLSNKEIAKERGVSAETVKQQVSVIFNKVGCWTRLELALWYWRRENPSMQALLERIARQDKVIRMLRKQLLIRIDKEIDKAGVRMPERKPLLKPQHDGLRRPEVTKEKPDVEAK